MFTLTGALAIANEHEGQQAGNLWMGAEAYGGYISGKYRFEGPVNPGFGQSGTLVFAPRVSGGVVGLSAPCR